MKRNAIVTATVVAVLALLSLAGWANWENRRQAAAIRAGRDAQTVLVADANGNPASGAASSVSSNDASGLSAAFQSPLKGKSAPPFTLEDLRGQKVSLTSYNGKALLLNFWATWCAPCKLETPWIVDLRAKYAPQGFEVLGISTEGEDLAKNDKAGWDKDKAAIGKFVQQMRVTYPMLIDGDSIAKRYGGLDELPTSFFVNRQGTIVAVTFGLDSKDNIEANIRKALGAGK